MNRDQMLVPLGISLIEWFWKWVYTSWHFFSCCLRVGYSYSMAWMVDDLFDWKKKTQLGFLDVRYKVCINSETTFIRLSRVFFSWYKHKVTNMVSHRDCLPLGIFNLSFRKKLSLFELSLFEFCKPPWW